MNNVILRHFFICSVSFEPLIWPDRSYVAHLNHGPVHVILVTNSLKSLFPFLD